MQDNFDTDPTSIRAKFGRGRRAKLNLQRAQSLGVAASTIGEVQGTGVTSAGTSSGSGAGIYSYQSGAEINPAYSSESYQETYYDTNTREFDIFDQSTEQL
jgi:hypothetical protein